MTLSEYILNFVLLAFVLHTNLGTHAASASRLLRPLVLVAITAAVFLGDVPGAGNDRALEAAGLLAGVALGVASALLVRVQRTAAGVVTTAGAGFAALWVAVIAGRVLFAYGADHWFSAAIVSFSRTHEITGSGAWAACFVLMALAMVLTRTVVTGAQVAVLQNRRAPLAA